MFVDMDDFKPVNDTYGHAAGDELLKQVGNRLKECLRKHDTVARTGGDEFVIVLQDVEDAKAATRIGEKILEELAKPVVLGPHSLDASCSIGISIYPQDGKDIATLTANADVARCTTRRNRGRTGSGCSRRKCATGRSRLEANLPLAASANRRRDPPRCGHVDAVPQPPLRIEDVALRAVIDGVAVAGLALLEERP